MKTPFVAFAASSLLFFASCASHDASRLNSTNQGSSVYSGAGGSGAGTQAYSNRGASVARRSTNGSGDSLTYENQNRSARSSGTGTHETTGRNAIGVWAGSNGAERITVKFGGNGSLILTNASGAEAGRWSAAGGGSYKIVVGEFSGEFVLLNSSTASFTLGGSHVEMRRSGG